MTTHLVIPDSHAHPDHHNKRAEYLGKLIVDVKPDVIINIGDGADMPSLSSYDKGKRSFHGRSYRKDIDAHLDFQEKMWAPLKRQKKKRPETIYLIGNHEQRIERALDLSPELEGTIGYQDLLLDQWYDTVVPYNGGTPGVISKDGVDYAHFFISGVMGRAVGGEHPATSLLTKRFKSSTCGHLHLADYSIRTDGSGKKMMGCFAGVYQDYDSSWAGEVNNLWWNGVVVKRNVSNGMYDPQFLSYNTIKKEYA